IDLRAAHVQHLGYALDAHGQRVAERVASDRVYRRGVRSLHPVQTVGRRRRDTGAVGSGKCPAFSLAATLCARRGDAVISCSYRGLNTCNDWTTQTAHLAQPSGYEVASTRL